MCCFFFLLAIRLTTIWLMYWDRNSMPTQLRKKKNKRERKKTTSNVCIFASRTNAYNDLVFFRFGLYGLVIFHRQLASSPHIILGCLFLFLLPRSGLFFSVRIGAFFFWFLVCVRYDFSQSAYCPVC